MEHSRAVVNVATGSYVKGQERLIEECARQGVDYVHFRDCLPKCSPTHFEKPYAFKAYAMAEAFSRGYMTLLWADACILPIRPLSEVFEKIEAEGYWIARNGFTNYEWTADSAYADLFRGVPLDAARIKNREIEHVVATAFGLDMRRIGFNMLCQYICAAGTNAFCGPWKNTPRDPCGPADVRGHRHDQTALSVIAWQNGCKLTDPPEVFAYKGTGPGWEPDPRTILLADGGY